MRKHTYPLWVLALPALLFSCSPSPSNKEDRSETAPISSLPPDAKPEVTTLTLTPQPFHHELISNGKVVPRAMANIYFQSSEIIAHIYVKNGDLVKKGQKLAELDKFRLSNKLSQARETMEKAELELQDVLIGQGYSPDNLANVPADIMQLAKLRSGYDSSKAQYELSKYEDENATLTAPFDGIVANLFSKPANMAGTSEPFCTIIDTRGMEVDFTVLENELSLVKSGDKVTVSPYADISSVYPGQIAEINPSVDDKGMVKVKARVDGGSKLFNGMNVRISVQRSLGQQLVIPKSAVVLRSGKQVVFTLKDGTAQWNYVHTELENAEHYTLVRGIKDTLHEGDVVITSGNINLAHESPVTVINR